MIALVQKMFGDIEIKGAAIVTNATKQEILIGQRHFVAC
jgi:hypothetical protein